MAGPRWGVALFVALLACGDADAPPRDAGGTDSGHADAATRTDAATPGDAGATDADAEPPVGPVPRDAAARDASDAARVDIDATTSETDDTVRCEIGVAEGDAGMIWAPLAVGGTLPMIGAGQGSLLVALGLRVLEPPTPVRVRLVVRTPESGRSASLQRNQEDGFDCDSEGWCTLVPLHVPTQNLVDDPFDLMLLDVAVTATIGDPGDPYCVATLAGALLRR